MKEMITCGHERALFHPATRKVVIRHLMRALNPHKDKFDAIAMSGYSMALIGSIIAYKLDKSFILVRKPSEQRNSDYKIEGILGSRYIIIDDLIATGNTFSRVIEECTKFECTMVGYCLFKSDDDHLDDVCDWADNPYVECFMAKELVPEIPEHKVLGWRDKKISKYYRWEDQNS